MITLCLLFFKRIRLIYFIIIFFIYVSCLTSKNLDSLYKVYKVTKDVKQKTHALLKYAEELLHHDFDSALVCGKIALNSAKELNDKQLFAEANIVTGFAFEANGKYKEALRNFLISAEICKKNKFKQQLARCYTAIGVIYWYQGFNKKAEEYFKKKHNYMC